MRHRQLTISAALALAALCTLAPAAQAGTWNKKTYLTVKEPIAIPGNKVLTPGEYVMKLMDNSSNRHIVQFFNEDESQIIATAFAIPSQRSEPTGKTELSWYEAPSDQPRALRSWFYPGDTIGQEFTYPADRAQQMSKSAKLSGSKASATAAVSKAHQEANLKPNNLGAEATQADKQPVEIAQAREPREQQLAQAAQPTPPQPEDAAPAEPSEPSGASGGLPETAGFGPLFALAGLLSLGGAVALRRLVS